MAVLTSSTAAAIGAGSAMVGAGAAAYGSYQSWQSARAGREDLAKVKELKGKQAEDILGQMGAEDVIYEDELDMIRKQTEMASKKLLAGTEAGIEKVGEQASGAVLKSMEVSMLLVLGKDKDLKQKVLMKKVYLIFKDHMN